MMNDYLGLKPRNKINPETPALKRRAKHGTPQSRLAASQLPFAGEQQDGNPTRVPGHK